MTALELSKLLAAIPGAERRVVAVCLFDEPYAEVTEVVEDEPDPGIVLIKINREQDT